jgi:predicted nucleic-acid-binding protein
LRITADTNLLVRAAIQDDPEQTALAVAILREAEIVVVTSVSLCEFAWVSTRSYRRSASETASAIRALVAAANVQADGPAVEAGLALMERGGDFADGVIAFEGRRSGGAVFASFDREAVKLVTETGGEALLLGALV